MLHHPHILYTDTKCYSTLISIVLCCATPPSYSYWYKVLLHPHIHSTLLCYTTLIFIVLCCATPPSYSHWYNVKRHLHIHSTLFCYTTLMFSPSLSLCYQVLHHPHIHGATMLCSTATLCCIAKCHSLIHSAILCYIVLHQPHTFIVVHGATTPSYIYIYLIHQEQGGIFKVTLKSLSCKKRVVIWSKTRKASPL